MHRKTKIIATIGPASNDRPMLEKLVEAGMNVARLNFSHGDFDTHAEVIQRLRAASAKTGKRLAIMADLPARAARAGVSVELVHLGSLYHDDVIDNADTRHGVKSVNFEWNNTAAILGGDFLLTW